MTALLAVRLAKCRGFYVWPKPVFIRSQDDRPNKRHQSTTDVIATGARHSNSLVATHDRVPSLCITLLAPPAATAVRPAPSTPTGPVGANQFSTEAQAKARCPSDTVVWANLKSKVYHFSGTKD